MHKLAGAIAQPDGSLCAGTVVFGPTVEQVVREGATGGDYILPGLIDLQVNGAFGIDVMSAAPGELVELSGRLAGEGTTGFLPTAITAPLDHLASVERAVAQARAKGESAGHAAILGLHSEGPFISKARLGVHPAAAVCEPRGEALAAVLGLGELRLVTLAPELPGAPEAIARLRRRAVAVALGHSDATLAQTQSALAAGAAMFTHLFNAMRPLHQREPGIVGAALGDSAALAAVIPDGIHLHREILRLVYRARSAAGMVLTSDSVAAAKTAQAPQGAARAGDGRLAGSLISLLDGVRLMVREVGISVGEAALMAAANPARILALSDRGRLVPGARADIVVLDHELGLKAVFIGGREIRLT